MDDAWPFLCYQDILSAVFRGIERQLDQGSLVELDGVVRLGSVVAADLPYLPGPGTTRDREVMGSYFCGAPDVRAGARIIARGDSHRRGAYRGCIYSQRVGLGRSRLA